MIHIYDLCHLNIKNTMIVVRRNDSIAEKHPSGQNADSCGAEMRYFFSEIKM